MTYTNLPKGSILYIEAKDLLNMSVSGNPTFKYPSDANTTITAGGQQYSSSIATKNILLPADKDTLKFRRISEHNRSEFAERMLRIEKTQRMANGLLRTFFVAEKKQWDIGWNLLPSFRNETVDGAWGAEDLKAFYESDAGKKAFRIKINTMPVPLSTIEGSNALATASTYTVVFTSCEFTVLKRGIQSYWSVKLSLEQV